jgi:alkanesulfonate monooxygenase SsuD/methylene tetrahydromethanopterin reductase-like flavin-dependent oxidoreductase (luciferase family)
MDAGEKVERLGFDSLWSNDHLFPVVAGPEGAMGAGDGPVFEGWAVLAGWAARTGRIRLGCLVSAAGYRNPALLVKVATALDHQSGGRLSLGLGAGWYEREHHAFGVAYPSLGQRLDRLEEAAVIARGLLDGATVTFDGRWHRADGARNDPPPLQDRLPLLIGGSGERRTLPLVARYADVWNGEGEPEAIARKNSILDGLCRGIGRAPSSIRRTVGLPVPVVRADEGEARTILASLLRRHGAGDADARRLAASTPFAGPAARIRAQLESYREAGAEEVVFDWPPPFDELTLEELAGIRQDP